MSAYVVFLRAGWLAGWLPGWLGCSVICLALAPKLIAGHARLSAFLFILFHPREKKAETHYGIEFKQRYRVCESASSGRRQAERTEGAGTGKEEGRERGK